MARRGAPSYSCDMQHSDVIILGGGLIGATLALALDAHGLSATVVDTADLSATVSPTHDGRASAVSSASHHMLEAIGVARGLDGQGCPIRAIRVSEGLDRGALDFDVGDSDRPLGIMYENRLLRQALLAALGEAQGVTLRAPDAAADIVRDAHGTTVTLAGGDVLKAPLLIAAEGRRSATREAAGIRIARWNYAQTAIVVTITHEVPHDGTAFEIFYPAGPFALLPLLDDAAGRHRSAIVWTVPGAQGAATAMLPERPLLAEIDKRIGGFLGKTALASPVWSYPLGFHQAERLVDTRLALVGDSGHGIHPIAGQGLNMGFRDVAALAECLVEGARLGLDLGDPQLLERYQRWRALDNMMVAASTDLLNRLFGAPGRGMSALRAFGLRAVDRLPPLKQRFMAEARGESGDLPRLLDGALV
jgi:2-octaprenyl-6-methoxyphenol hydroxylase